MQTITEMFVEIRQIMAELKNDILAGRRQNGQYVLRSIGAGLLVDLVAVVLFLLVRH